MKLSETAKDWVTIALGILLSGSACFFALHTEAESIKKEEQRRAEMTKTITDENGK
jgi:hypothetical protein